MIKEAYVSYEVAKLLKEKGFDEHCDNYYDQSSDEPQQFTLDEMYYSCDEFIKAPTHQMACAWLREKHLIHIEVVRGYDHFFICITKMLPFREYDIKDDTFDNYEEAVEAALKYTLENLI